MSSNVLENFIFHEDNSDIGDGNILTITNNMSTVNFEVISSDDNDFEAMVYAQLVDSDRWYNYPCFKLPTYELIDNSFSESGYIYTVDVSAISKIFIRLLSNTGLISIYGKVVS